MPTRCSIRTRSLATGALIALASALSACALPPSPTATLPTTTAKPTTTAPAPAPTGAASWPGPRNTGVPAGTVLKASGTITVTTTGAVVDGLDITGCVYVRANNVTIRRTRVTSTGCTDTVQNHASNLVLEDVEINGSNRDDHCLVWGSYAARRVNMHHCSDGAYLLSNTTIESTYIHDLWVHTGSHNDAVQLCGEAGSTQRNINLRGNNFDVTSPGVTSAIMLGDEFGPSDGVTIDRNRLNGGGFTFYGGAGKIANLVVTNNTFGQTHDFGTHAYVASNTTWSGNVMEGTGALLGK